MEHQSARWRPEDVDDAPHQQPMAAGLRPAQRKAPTADQKKARREMARKTASLTVCAACTAPSSGCCGQCGCLVTTAKTATVIDTAVADARGRMLLNAGDAIQMPNGQVVNVKGVRRHETSGDHYYVDTDAGTTVVPYSTNFKVVPQGSNSTRMPPNPDYGRPGGDFNNQPGPTHPHDDQSNTMKHGHVCPACGSSGSMEQQGQGYVCSRCGFKSNIQGGQTFSDATQTLSPGGFKAHKTAVARRAAQVLAITEGDTL